MQNLIDNFFSYTITGLTIGAVYALVALGYTLVYGVLRLINFAHSEVFMYGTFASLWVVMILGGHPGAGVGQVIFWVAMMFVAAMAMSGMVLNCVGSPLTTQRPFSHSRSSGLVSSITAAISFAFSRTLRAASATAPPLTGVERLP